MARLGPTCPSRGPNTEACGHSDTEETHDHGPYGTHHCATGNAGVEWPITDEDRTRWGIPTEVQTLTDEGDNLRATLARVRGQRDEARAERDRAHAETWAIAAETLTNHADTWEEDGSDPCRVRICRDMARAFRTYAKGTGVPTHLTLRQRRDEARAERDQLATELGDMARLADQYNGERSRASARAAALEQLTAEAHRLISAGFHRWANTDEDPHGGHLAGVANRVASLLHGEEGPTLADTEPMVTVTGRAPASLVADPGAAYSIRTHMPDDGHTHTPAPALPGQTAYTCGLCGCMIEWRLDPTQRRRGAGAWVLDRFYGAKDKLASTFDRCPSVSLGKQCEREDNASDHPISPDGKPVPLHTWGPSSWTVTAEDQERWGIWTDPGPRQDTPPTTPEPTTDTAQGDTPDDVDAWEQLLGDARVWASGATITARLVTSSPTEEGASVAGYPRRPIQWHTTRANPSGRLGLAPFVQTFDYSHDRARGRQLLDLMAGLGPLGPPLGPRVAGRRRRG